MTQRRMRKREIQKEIQAEIQRETLKEIQIEILREIQTKNQGMMIKIKTPRRRRRQIRRGIIGLIQVKKGKTKTTKRIRMASEKE
jgi:polynucleotide 5'-kinase involved in rRNA processing